MKNSEKWKPSKFEKYGTKWRGSRDSNELAVSSRITSDAAIKSYQTYIEKYAKGHLIDFGCGKVPLYGIYKDLVTEVTTVDWSHSIHGISYVDLVADLNLPTILPSNKFDTLLSTSVIEHIRKPDIFFSEVSRILAPTGVAIIATPFLYSLHEEPYDYYRFTEYGLKVLCEDNNLEIISTTYYGGLPEVLGDLISKLFIRPRRLNKLIVHSLQLILGLRFLQKLSVKTQKKFPLGYTIAVRKVIKNKM